MIILLHSSKTMKPTVDNRLTMSSPIFLNRAKKLNNILKKMNIEELIKVMKISGKLAQATSIEINNWSTLENKLGMAILSFRGDVYSGLQVDSLSQGDLKYANEKLRILSGLYGILRPLDGISPYRMEMAYRFNNSDFKSLYNYWGDSIAKSLDDHEIIVNLTSNEYSKVIDRFIDKNNMISPKFLTYNKNLNIYTNVAVHSKIARGAFANWLIKNRVNKKSDLSKFDRLGYEYSPELSSNGEPIFVCHEFGGRGLSVRLK